MDQNLADACRMAEKFADLAKAATGAARMATELFEAERAMRLRIETELRSVRGERDEIYAIVVSVAKGEMGAVDRCIAVTRDRL